MSAPPIAGRAERRAAAAPARPRPAARRAAAVYKFGGAALADAAAVRAAVAIVRRRVAPDGAVAAAAHPTVVVASALAGVTDALLALARGAADPAHALEPEIARLRDRHHAVADALAAGDGAGLRAELDATLDEVATLARGARLAGGAAPRQVDALAARGERLSATLLAAALRADGLPAALVDAVALVHTDGRAGGAAPDVAATGAAVRAALRPRLARGEIPVVAGYVGRGPAGELVTLGRGGSDLTATLVGRALGAARIVLWKDVPGLLTADPRLVPDARVIRRASAADAAALARHGARVLHSRALPPLEGRTRLVVRPFADPAAAGTEITARAGQAPPALALAATLDQTLLTLPAAGGAGRALAALAALDAAGVAPAAAAFGPDGLSLLVAGADAAAAVAALRALAPDAEAPGVRPGVATVALVGAGGDADPALAARALAALADAGVPVLASAHGGGAALSLVVDAARAADAQQALHRALALGRSAAAPRGRPRPPRDVVLLGAGAIGRELLAQLARDRRAGGPALRVCGVMDRSGWLFDPEGLSGRLLARLRAAKAAGRPVAALAGGRAGDAHAALAAMAAHALSRPILVDVTAHDSAPVLERALAAGWDVVLANKVPLAAPQAAVDRLHAVAEGAGARLLHEATVGAGLPVIDTLHKLLDAGDRVHRVEGCPSGTLGFLFAALGEGRRFSEALGDAVARGYTEPDPRVDLAGLDVARKALILARLLGFRGDLADVAVESLVPPALRELPRDEFLARLPELDDAWAERAARARRAGCVLRYRARATARAVTVGLVEVPLGDPLGGLRGTDNQFAFTTSRYAAQPLVITGPGAGAAVTAAGVYNDLARLAAERPRAGGGA